MIYFFFKLCCTMSCQSQTRYFKSGTLKGRGRCLTVSIGIGELAPLSLDSRQAQSSIFFTEIVISPYLVKLKNCF